MINQEKSNSELDLAYLREMSGDSAEFMIEMLETMEMQIPLYLKDLQDAVAASNWKLAYEFAHKVKPTFFYVGRDDLRDYMQVIERKCKEENDLENVPGALAEVMTELTRVWEQVAAAKTKLSAQL